MATRTDVKTETLLQLAERCEAATGPDRELDAAIACALSNSVESDDGDYWWGPYNEPPIRVPDFTASLDAAMTLVPDEHEGLSLVWSRTGCWSLCLYNSDIMATGATRPLALCAAALRARAA